VSTNEGSGSSFAYRVPTNPEAASPSEWATLVHERRVRPGDVVDLSSSETSPGGEVVIGEASSLWEVVAIEPVSDLGKPAVIRRKGAGEAIWDGALILRRVET
jgi:hypothetical protein